uniref:FHA domain-containing protein n=1 Tax=Neogobius melanostomus TaxID=47308 RepID=A0A8C6V2A3_9GOBI
MMDATQMICDSILESDEEENDDKGDPLGKLCILKNEHIPEKECLLYLGDNVLGRDPNTCSLPLLSPSVSKQHATISLSLYRRKGSKDEVEALLWDLGSLNGTRKGHLKLTPNPSATRLFKYKNCINLRKQQHSG